MYICDLCHEVTEPGQSRIPIIKEKREKEYPNGKIGWEIVIEIQICSGCAESSQNSNQLEQDI